MKLIFGDCQDSHQLQMEVITNLEIEKDRLLANNKILNEKIVQLEREKKSIELTKDEEIIGLKAKLLGLTQYSTKKDSGLIDEEQQKQMDEFLGGQNIKNKDYEAEKGKKNRGGRL